MSEKPEDFLSLSKEALDDIGEMLDTEVSVRALYSRLYYALFYAAKAALVSEGVTPKTHRGTASQLNQVLYDDKEMVAREEAILLQRMQQKRDMADYELEVKFDRDDFKQDLDKVKGFLDTARSIIKD